MYTSDSDKKQDYRKSITANRHNRNKTNKNDIIKAKEFPTRSIMSILGAKYCRRSIVSMIGGYG